MGEVTFADFWQIARHWRGRCPNPRKPAERAWIKVLRDGADPREIVAGAKGYYDALMDMDTDPQFACQAATFLNQWRWEQYLGEDAAKRFLQPDLRVIS